MRAKDGGTREEDSVGRPPRSRSGHMQKAVTRVIQKAFKGDGECEEGEVHKGGAEQLLLDWVREEKGGEGATGRGDGDVTRGGVAGDGDVEG